MKLLHVGLIISLFLVSFLHGANEKVTLLLKWNHQFQFAGYYMAKEKGYYDELGLDVSFVVSIDENNPDILEKSPATYATLDPIALIEQVKGKKIRALGAIFQQSPLVFIALKSSGIQTPQDFVGKRVMSVLGKTDSSLVALLKHERISKEQFKLISKHPSIDDLIENRVDVIAAYLSDAPAILQKLGYEYNIIDPLAYGIDFYGDMLFTSQQEASDNPSRVKRFLTASNKGWKYALENIDETVNLIQKKYASSLDKTTLQYEAMKIKELMTPDRIPIGMMNDRKINSMLSIYDELGYINLLQYSNNIATQNRTNFVDALGFWKQLSNDEKLFLQQHPKLTVGVRDNYLPFFGLDEDGATTGLIVDLNKKLESIIGITLVLEPMLIRDMREKIEKKEIDLFYGTQVGHGNSYMYTKSFGSYSGAAFSKNSDLKINSLETLKNRKIAITQATSGEKVLSSMKEFEVFAKRDIFELFDSVSVGESVVLLEAKPAVDYYKNKYKINDLYLNGVFYQSPLNLSLVMQKNQLIAKNIFDKAIEYIGSRELEKLFALWISDEAYLHKLKLNEEERDFLSKNGIIKVGTDQSWPPFDFVKNGKSQGYGADFLALIEKRLGVHFEFINKYPWHETLKRFKDKEIDMMSIVAKNDERSTYMLFSTPILSSSIGLAYKKESAYTTLETLNENSLKLGIIKDFWLHEKVKKLYPNIKIISYTSITDALKDIQNGKLDAFSDVSISLSYHLNRNLITDIAIQPTIKLQEQNYEKFHVGIHKELPLLHSIIQKTIDSLPEAELLELQRKWFGNVLEGSTSKQLLLSETEKNFLSSHQKIRFGIDKNWAPFDFIDENGNHQGIVKEMAQYIFQENLELQLENISQQDWSEHINAIENKKIDVIAGIAKSPQRASKMLFSIPYLKVPLMVVGRLDGVLIESLSELEGESVGVINGYITNVILNEKYPNIKATTYPDAKSGLIALSRGEINYFFDSIAAINDAIKANGLTNLKLLGKTEESIELSFGIRNDWPQLKEAINKMINSMPKEKINSILNNWVSIKTEQKVDYSLLWKLLVTFILITSFIIYWNRKLSREISRRKIVEKELYEAQIKAENANRAKSEFLSNMSHEIRTPMNAVIGFAELTAKMDLPAKALQNINTIQKSAKSLIAIINDILDLSKIEAGKINIQVKPTNVKNLAEDLYSIFGLRASNKNIFFDRRS